LAHRAHGLEFFFFVTGDDSVALTLAGERIARNNYSVIASELGKEPDETLTMNAFKHPMGL
jgi:hypothetical protein